VTVDKLQMGNGDNETFVPSATPTDAIQGYGNVTYQDGIAQQFDLFKCRPICLTFLRVVIDRTQSNTLNV